MEGYIMFSQSNNQTFLQGKKKELIFPGFVVIKVNTEATFRFCSFTFKEELILQTEKESTFRDKEGRTPRASVRAKISGLSPVQPYI